MHINQTTDQTAPSVFPKSEVIKSAFEKVKDIGGKEGFLIGHNTMLDATVEVLQVVSEKGDAIPPEVAYVVARGIRHFLSAENIVLEQYHHGLRFDLTRAAEKGLHLVLAVPDAALRIASAEFAVHAIEALRKNFKYDTE